MTIHQGYFLYHDLRSHIFTFKRLDSSPIYYKYGKKMIEVLMDDFNGLVWRRVIEVLLTGGLDRGKEGMVDGF